MTYPQHSTVLRGEGVSLAQLLFKLMRDGCSDMRGHLLPALEDDSAITAGEKQHHS